MKINKIIKLKDNKYKIIIDNEPLITYDNVILENDLLYKKEIDSSLYKKMLDRTLYYDIYNKVVKYILKKRRSRKEIVEYINKFNISENLLHEMIIKLEEINLINDNIYASSYINDKVYLSNNGINKIRIDLLNQDIPIEIIDNEISKIDNEIINNKLEKIIIKKIKTNHKYSENHLRQKILIELLNLGYSKNNIIEIIDKNINNSNDNILNSEFEKIYKKLSLKYNGFDLDNKIKQKLVQKGFKLEEINLLLDEKKRN